MAVPQTFEYEDVKALLKESLADGRLDAGEVLKIAMKVAEKANQLAGLSGAEKKLIVIHVVEDAVRTAVPAEQAEQVASTALQVLPAVLDIAVAAARGRLALKEAVKQKVSVACLVDCFAGLFGRRVAAPSPLSVKEPVPVAQTLSEAAPFVPAAPAPAAPPVVPTPESAASPLQSQPEPAPPQETPAEPTPEASSEAPPLESRPAEEPEITLPNTATDPAPQ